MKPLPRSHGSFTRRQMLGLLGAGSMGVLAACGGVAALLLGRPVPRVVVLPTATLAEAAVRPPMVSRAAWGAQPPDHNAINERGFFSADNPFGWRVYDDLSLYRTLVIHHSVIYGTDDADTMRQIQRLHQGDRGWADIGYHVLVGKSGTLYEGRDLLVRGTHAGGYNTGSVGVCLLGNTSVDDITDTQWTALNSVCGWLRALLPVTHVAAHREFNANTECPGERMMALLDPLAAALGLLRGTSGYETPITYEPVRECACGTT